MVDGNVVTMGFAVELALAAGVVHALTMDVNTAGKVIQIPIQVKG